MIIKLLIAVIAILIITLLSIINLVIIIIHSQNEILQAKRDLEDSSRSYVDLLPIIWHKIGLYEKGLYQMRTNWYATKSWEKWVQLDKESDDILIDFTPFTEAVQPFVDDLKKREIQVRSYLHDYNSAVIKYNHQLEKKQYKFAKMLDFRYGDKTYDLLEDF